MAWDPAGPYAQDVLDGRIVSNAWVAGACRRHIDWLETAGQRGYAWDEESADIACRFFENVLTMPPGEYKGQPFVLRDWQEFVTRYIYGWRHADTGDRVTERVYLQTAKGSGKSPWAAGMLLAHLLIEGRTGARAFIVGSSLEQSCQPMQVIADMIDQSPILTKRLRYVGGGRPDKVYYKEAAGIARALGWGNRQSGLSGEKVSFVHGEEYHEHKDETQLDMMTAGFKEASSPLTLITTNAGRDELGACGRERAMAQRIAAGVQDADHYLPLVYEVDADDDPWEDESCWAKGNPSHPDLPGLKRVYTHMTDAGGSPSKRAEVERLRFSRWGYGESPWMSPRHREALFVDALSPEEERRRVPAYLGVDLSRVNDMTAICVAWDFGEWVEVETHSWLPEENLDRREKEDNAPYREWAAAGHLNLTDSDAIDLNEIAEFVAELADRWQPKMMASDAFADSRFHRALRQAGVSVDRKNGHARMWHVRFDSGYYPRRVQVMYPGQDVEERPVFYMSGAISVLEDAIDLDNPGRGGVRILRNPVMLMAMGGVDLEFDNFGNRKPTKASRWRRIDAAVAMLIAVSCANEMRPHWGAGKLPSIAAQLRQRREDKRKGAA